eukprot:632761-Prymnesium_polylepis.1
MRAASLDAFRQALDRYAAQVDLFRRMQPAVLVGLFRANASALRDVFLPSPQRCLDEIHRLLPKMATDGLAGLLQEVTDADTRVMHQPDGIKEFVELTLFQQSLGDKYAGFAA